MSINEELLQKHFKNGRYRVRQIWDEDVKPTKVRKERYYPTYQYTIWWELTNPMSKYDNELPIVESSSWYRQYREPPTPEDLESELRKLWLAMLTAERGSLPTLADRGAKLIAYQVEILEIETWYQIWFQHASRNTDLSDDELLESFGHFVDRKREADRNNQNWVYMTEEERAGKEFYCLMGAEDRWRWKGPCRCEHCKEQGIVRIDH